MSATQKSGTFFFVVGPSGAGKDSLIDGARAVLPSDKFVFARRTITRPHGSPGEDHEACTEAEFASRVSQGGFLITWQAHGLHYGLSSSLLDAMTAGQNIIANGSRAMVTALQDKIPALIVIEVNAPKHILETRLASRGRETPEDVARRLNRTVVDYPEGQHVLRVINDGTLTDGIDRFINAIEQQLNS
jgi:thymidine phosphorylase